MIALWGLLNKSKVQADRVTDRGNQLCEEFDSFETDIKCEGNWMS